MIIYWNEQNQQKQNKFRKITQNRPVMENKTRFWNLKKMLSK